MVRGAEKELPEEFLAQKQALAIELMHRLIARRGFDLDPKTEDKAL